MLLAALGLALGLLPRFVDPLVSSAVAAIARQPSELHLALWHGFNAALALSIASLGLGIVCYLAWTTLHLHKPRFEWLLHMGPERGYQHALSGLNALAAGQTNLLQSGYLRFYLLIILATTVALVGGTLIRSGDFRLTGGFEDVRFYHWGLVILILLAALFAITSRSRLAAIAGLGVVGYSVALVFVLFGAPDVAMTQFLIETLTVILFVLVFYHLPESPEISKPVGRGRDALVAIGVGILMASLVVVATRLQFEASISSFYARESYEQAHGRNVVNVILVDFRGLDTLGEITVLAIASIGVYALLRLRFSATPTQSTTQPVSGETP
jgi:multicomponent Na+:H+ antiporter subunit A